MRRPGSGRSPSSSAGGRPSSNTQLLLAVAFAGPGRPRDRRSRASRSCCPSWPLPLASPVAADRPHLQRAAPAQPRAQGDRPAGADLQPAVRRRARDRGRRRVTTARALVADRVRIPFRRPFATASGMWVERDAWIIRLFDARWTGRARRGGPGVRAGRGGRDDPDGALIREAVESATTTGLPIDGRARGARRARPGAERGDRERDRRPRPAGRARPGARWRRRRRQRDAAVARAGGARGGRPAVGRVGLRDAQGQGRRRTRDGGPRRADPRDPDGRRARCATSSRRQRRVGPGDRGGRLEAIARFDIEFVEQPLAAHDLDGLAELRRRVRVPIAADEAAESLARRPDAPRHATRSTPSSSSPPGSAVRRSSPRSRRWQPRAACRSSSARCSRPASGSRRRWPWRQPCPRSRGRAGSIPPDHGLATAGLLEHDLLTESLVVAEGRMRVPATPGSGGLGITLDERALERFRVDADRVAPMTRYPSLAASARLAAADARPGPAVVDGRDRLDAGRSSTRAPTRSRGSSSALAFDRASRVAMVAAPSAAAVATLHAIARVGGVAAPLGAGLTASELVVAGEVIAPDLVVHDPALEVAARALGAPMRSLDELTAASPRPDTPDTLAPLAVPAPDPAAPAVIVLTSGTTGRPKAVVLSTAALVASAEAWLAALPEATGWLLAVGLAHVAGLGVVWRAALSGVPLVVLARPDPAAILAALGAAPTSEPRLARDDHPHPAARSRRRRPPAVDPAGRAPRRRRDRAGPRPARDRGGLAGRADLRPVRGRLGRDRVADRRGGGPSRHRRPAAARRRAPHRRAGRRRHR